MPLAMEENPRRLEVDRFVLAEIDSVPHIEALLLLWNGRATAHRAEKLTALLYLPIEHTLKILEDLQQRNMILRTEAGYAYNPDYPRDDLMQQVDKTWRSELVRLSNMIHSKASPAVREFARAFRLKKD